MRIRTAFLALILTAVAAGALCLRDAEPPASTATEAGVERLSQHTPEVPEPPVVRAGDRDYATSPTPALPSPSRSRRTADSASIVRTPPPPAPALVSKPRTFPLLI